MKENHLLVLFLFLALLIILSLAFEAPLVPVNTPQGQIKLSFSVIGAPLIALLLIFILLGVRK